MLIGIKTKFDAAHFLPNYPGKCKEMHGHTWTVEVEISGTIDEEDGMVLDLTILKAKVREVTDSLDHKVLNDIFSFRPTCELIAAYIKEQIDVDIKKLKPGVRVCSVKVQEGDGGWAIAC